METHQFHTKTTEKFAETDNRALPFSSLKKSERSIVNRENFGSLIFETPPKGKPDRNFFKMVDSSRFFMDRIEMSPTPLKIEYQSKQ
jgi:hypothetical protein